jgi:hypothetical protein
MQAIACTAIHCHLLAGRAGRLSDVLVRLATPDEYAAVGALRQAAYAHDYDMSDDYRERLRDAAPRGAGQEAGDGVRL